MSALLAYDAGTGSIRAILFDLQGNELAIAQREWVHPPNLSYLGSMDFDYEKNWELVKECTREVLQKSKIGPTTIKAISATSMREGFVLYDKDGKEIWGCANVDARASNEVVALKQIEENMERTIYTVSGQTLALAALPRLLWLQIHEPTIYRNMHSFSMINDWILYKLSGVLQVDPSNGCTTGIFHLADRKWESSLSTMCTIHLPHTPTVNEAGTIIGSITKESAKETGLAINTPVVTGGGDAQMASIGSAVIKDGETFICGGSFWQQEVNITEAYTDPDARIRVNCHAIPNMWQYETIAFFPGLVMRWFRDTFCEEEKKKALALDMDPYELLEEQAKDVPPGSNGIIPIFSNTMNFISWRHAAPSFLNLSLDSTICGKKEIFRAIEENACFVTLGNLKLIEQLTGSFPQEVIFAGGASKGKLWCQILADVLGVRVKVPVVKEAAALGTALMAGVGVGVFKTIEDAVQTFVKWDTTYEPNMDVHKQYSSLYENWRTVYATQLTLADNGYTSHMWKAPGSI
ncbi:autoinducer-2 kinase [Priestia taiwanensis]|uniref:Autoinducer-2 kinase n=1 Tax=Priestia taiwanensis TaxID=1347902 RepID=A0A917EM84_9BACI|nr:autoinducer-2 kinase [Priestia taiwanensis]MBM7362447.1 autoinducer 2 (AI-2) kinase [Priestia taiwanensis]GGE62294.1 autoinducer-2 kinase [Priestia taiwanensis]